MEQDLKSNIHSHNQLERGRRRQNTRRFIYNRFAPLRHKYFRRFFLAQSLSLTGNWMQELAKSWIVLSLLGKSSAMGILLCASAIPNLIFGSRGGNMADQRGLREILMLTQLALSVLAFALGVIVSTGHIQFWHLVVFSIFEGCIIAFDLPAFNKITPNVVPREDFQQALALNAVNFHTSRVLGPSIAGVIMSLWGAPSVFWINCISFAGIILVISSVPALRTQVDKKMPVQKGMSAAIHAIRGDPVVLRALLQLFLVIGLLFPLGFTTFRVYLQHKFALTSQEFGFVFSAPGFGALLGGVTFLLWSPRNPLKALPFGIAGIVVFLIALAEANSLRMAVIFLGCFSYCMFLSISSINVTIQLRISNEIRGRIAAVVGMAFVSLGPIMSMPIGLLSDALGERTMIFVVTSIFLVGSLALAYFDKGQGETAALV